jgi:hypothetical protein
MKKRFKVKDGKTILKNKLLCYSYIFPIVINYATHNGYYICHRFIIKIRVLRVLPTLSGYDSLMTVRINITLNFMFSQ